MVEFKEICDEIKIEGLNDALVNISAKKSLQEEHRKTGRGLAAGIVIFLVCLGLYHAGSSRLSALVGGFIIMLLYVISLLYSWHRKKKLTKSNEAALEREIKEVIVNASKSAKKSQEATQAAEGEKKRPESPRFVRTYSVG